MLKLQLFANIDDIIEQHQDDLKDLDVKGSFDSISTKLSELGYDVLINQKDKAEFVPSSRLSEVVSQRDSFKQKVETLNEQLAELQKIKGNSDELNLKIKTLMDSNAALLSDLEKYKMDTAIIIAAKEAHDPKALIPFINKDNIKVTQSGEIVGIEAEILRLKTEMPYMFTTGNKQSKAGTDHTDGAGAGTGKQSMNSMIRKAAGRTF